MQKRYSLVVLSGLIALAACIVLAPTPSNAARAKAKTKLLSGKGTIKVTVKDEAGNAVPGVVVSAMEPARKAAPATQPATQPAVRAAGKGGRGEAVAEGVTDANGMVVLSDVPFGPLVLQAREKKVGAARERVALTSTTPLDVTLNLKGKKK